MKHIIKNIFLLPCLPYHLSVFIWVNYLALIDNDLEDILINGDIDPNKRFEEFIEKFDKKTMPFQLAYCTFFWLWLFVID